MVLVLKKEVVKTNNVEHEDTGKYRQLLVRTLHQCSVKFPDVASTIIPVVRCLSFLLACPSRYQSILCCPLCPLKCQSLLPWRVSSLRILNVALLFVRLLQNSAVGSRGSISTTKVQDSSFKQNKKLLSVFEIHNTTKKT